MTDIPKLTHDPSSFAKWRTAIEVALQLADAWNAALGLDAEPGRARFILRDVTPAHALAAPASPPTTQQRTMRAGSVMPEAAETPNGAAMTAEQRGEWEKWQRRENRAQAMIKGSISMALKIDLDEKVSAGEMWRHCVQLHTLNTAEGQHEILRTIHSLDLRGDATAEEMAAHVEHFASLIMEGRVIGIEYSSLERAKRFMSTILDPSFRSIINDINTVPETERTWPFVIRKFNAEAARRLARPMPRVGGRSNGTILASMGDSRITREAVGRGKGRAPKDVSKIECYECHKKGHYARDCRSKLPRSGGEGGGDGGGPGGRGSRRRGRPGPVQGSAQEREAERSDKGRISLSQALFDNQDTWAGLMVEEDALTESWADVVNDGGELKPIIWPEDIVDPWKNAGAALFTEDAVLLVGEPIEPSWVVDSGATHHITPHRGLLRDMQTLAVPKRFGLADKGSSMEATAVGSVRVKLPSGRNAKLQDVYLVPESRVSLLSLSSLLKQGWNADIKDKGGSLCHGKDKLALTRRGQLWSVVLGTIEPLVLAMGLGKDGRTPLEREHQRLGHIGREKLLDLAKAGKLTIKHEDARGDPFKTSSCEVCLRAKIERHPKSGKAPLLRGNGEGVGLDVDLAGPLDESIDGHRYLFVGIERSNEIVFAKPILTKANAWAEVKAAVATLERQLGERVRVVRTDGGTEFDSSEAREWYRSTGIQHYVTPRYTPELNGAAERMVRTLKDMTASLLADARLPSSFWSFAARYSAVILMKTSLKTTSPWSKLTGRADGVDSLKRFGQRCFMQVPRQARRKADLTTAKGESAIILGQPEGVSGWLVRLDKDGSLFNSRDVRFIDDYLKPEGGDPSAPPVVRGMSGVTTHPRPDFVPPHEDEDESFEEGRSVPLPRVSDQSPPPEDGGEAARPIAEVSNDEPMPAGETMDAPTTSEAGEAADRVSKRKGRSYVPVKERWAYVPVEEETQAEEWSGSQSRSGRPLRLPSRFAGLASEMAMDGDRSPGEPKTAREALAGPDANRWLASMESEIANIESKGTWVETKLPAGRKAVGCKWVFKVKTDADGRVVKYKSRLVAQGFSQIPGVDYAETFAPVGRSTSLRLLLTLAATHDLEVRQADVEGAYLNGKLDVELYMAYPEGMTPKAGCDALRLLGSLYGLKQSGRTWWIELGKGLEALGFRRTESDWGLYYRPKTRDRGTALLLAYVDDIVIAARTTGEIDEVMRGLAKRWRITELGEVSTILGMKVSRNRCARKVWLTQPSYIDRLAERFPGHRARSTPLPLSRGSSNDIGESPAAPLTPFQEVVGCLRWVAGCTRPDISFAASYLARQVARPSEHLMQIALGVVAYLSSTRTVGLTLGGTAHTPLTAWVDSDFAGCHETRRSTTGWILELFDSPIVWSSRRQATVSSSTVEAEYIAITEAGKEVIWMSGLLETLGYRQPTTTLFCDNQGAIQLSQRPTSHPRTKHIDIRHHQIREWVDRGIVRLQYVETKRQRADILTKSLPGPAHARGTSALRLSRPTIHQHASIGLTVRKSPSRGDGARGAFDVWKTRRTEIRGR